MTDDKRREAVLRGDVFCSPRCGFNCKKASYDRAVEEAAALASSLGEGWSPSVWENCGWCYNAVKGVAAVHPSRTGSGILGNWVLNGYSAYFNSARQSIGHGTTPRAAIERALSDARATVEKLSLDIAAI